MIINTKAGPTNVSTGEIYERPPRRTYTAKRTKYRPSIQRDLTIALAIYSFGATCVIAGLLA